MAISIQDIKNRISASFNPDQPPESPYPEDFLNSEPRRAAVLIPFYWDDNQWQVLYIRRTKNKHDRHSGQVAFPGGSCESHEIRAEDAALREASEEIGLNPEIVQLVGNLREMLTISNFRVTPVVGLIPWPQRLIPQPEEVSRIFSIPLNWLANPQHRVIKQREIPQINVTVPVIFFKLFDGELLWGAIARITIFMLEALGLADPEHRYK